MAIASITAWLNDPNRNYLHGKALYEQYGDNKAVLALIRSGSGSFHLAKLKEGLEKLNLLANLEPKPIVINDHRPEPAAAPGKTNPDFTSAPDQILRIRNEKNEKYAQARKLHETIRVMDSRQHRLQAGLQLLDLMDEVNESWSIIDEWKEKGTIREKMLADTEKSVAELTLAELLQESRNIPPNITKDRKKLPTATDAKKVDIALRLEAREARLKAIKKRLDEIV